MARYPAQIVVAQREDQPAWLELAREVEPLFGPMVNDPGFHRALENNIARGTAYCVCVKRMDHQEAHSAEDCSIQSSRPSTKLAGWRSVKGVVIKASGRPW